MGTETVGQPSLTGSKVAEELIKCGITHVVWVADVMCSFLTEELKKRPECTLIPVCREGEALPVATGLIMGGKEPITLCQNSGFLESGDSVTQIGLNLNIPLLMLIGYRGYRHNKAEVTDPPALYIEPVLNAMGIKSYTIETDEDIPSISRAYKKAHETKKPVAVLIAWELYF